MNRREYVQVRAELREDMVGCMLMVGKAACALSRDELGTADDYMLAAEQFLKSYNAKISKRHNQMEMNDE